ncbi:hypothetical protein BJV74DRAFT_884552 [Russula compacta]|nr:hypothetical protein BJV74DRAFT_884552 [Russula compacta]
MAEGNEPSSPDITSSEAAIRFRSSSASPHRKEGHRNSVRSASVDGCSQLGDSKSTPTLHTSPLDLRVVRLRALANKLKFLFTAGTELLTAVLSSDSLQSPSLGFIDSRGPPPRHGQPLVHVFINYAVILVGFLSYYLQRHPHHLIHTKVAWMSHTGFTLILERGRSVTRRVLVASSPLYQPMKPATKLGYEVHVYAGAPDSPDRVSSQRHRHSRGRSGSSSGAWNATKDHTHGPSSGVVLATDSSEPKSSDAPPVNRPRSALAPGNRLRYREQGADELLQLKLLQAIADVDVPPPGSTIVVARGDGNVGQFNEGFRGCVRTALEKGWCVELYA